MGRRDEEFERVALPHASSLLRFALRLTRDSALAEDLVQEAFMRAWRGFDGPKSQDQARAWLFHIFYNAYCVRGEKQRVAPLDPASAAATIAASDCGLLEVLQALERLSPDDRAALLLAAAEGFTCLEIAGILSVPVETAMSRLGHARQNLRAALHEQEAAPR